MASLPVTIFHTNDMHGHLDEMARLSTFARQQRASAAREGHIVFFWDAGDAADRRVRLCSLTKGAAFAPILNAMGYILQTMGNALSLPYGPQALAGVAARADFPVLAANFRDGHGPLVDGLQPYALVPLPGDLTMGVIGLTAPWGDFYEVFGLHLPDFVSVARDLVDELRVEGAAPIVVLSHLGLEDDRRLAEAIPAIDLIIGAHSHDRLPEGELHHGTLIAQAGDYARWLGRVDLRLDPQTGRVLARAARVLAVPDDVPPDPTVLDAIAAAEREVAELMAQPVGEVERALHLDHFGECGIGNLTADALRERMDADAALVMSGLFHSGLPAGVVTLGDLDAACFSTANPYVSEVRGAQLRAALERGLDPAVSEARPPTLRGVPVGTPQISGLVVEYDPGAAPGDRVRRVLVGDSPLDPEATYRLAHTDAETSRVGYFQLAADQPSRAEVPTIVREVLEDYLRAHRPLPAPPVGRWRRL